VLFGGSVGQLKDAASRAVLMIILRKNRTLNSRERRQQF
jgi:hypothetical protein